MQLFKVIRCLLSFDDGIRHAAQLVLPRFTASLPNPGVPVEPVQTPQQPVAGTKGKKAKGVKQVKQPAAASSHRSKFRPHLQPTVQTAPTTAGVAVNTEAPHAPSPFDAGHADPPTNHTAQGHGQDAVPPFPAMPAVQQIYAHEQHQMPLGARQTTPPPQQPAGVPSTPRMAPRSQVNVGPATDRIPPGQAAMDVNRPGTHAAHARTPVRAAVFQQDEPLTQAEDAGMQPSPAAAPLAPQHAAGTNDTNQAGSSLQHAARNQPIQAQGRAWGCLGAVGHSPAQPRGVNATQAQQGAAVDVGMHQEHALHQQQQAPQARPQLPTAEHALLQQLQTGGPQVQAHITSQQPQPACNKPRTEQDHVQHGNVLQPDEQLHIPTHAQQIAGMDPATLINQLAQFTAAKQPTIPRVTGSKKRVAGMTTEVFRVFEVRDVCPLRVHAYQSI